MNPLAAFKWVRRTFGAATWWTLAVAGVVAVLLLWWLLASLETARNAAREAQAGATLAGARGQAGGEAIVIQDGALTAAVQSESLRRESSDVIHQASGADQRLDPDLNRTARERLCLREAYRGRPECALQPAGRAKP